jgi:folate-binding protein YgfZ
MEDIAHAMPLESPLLDLHKSAGAEIGEYFGALLPAGFGDFEAEYKAVRDSVAVADTNFRAIFSLTGPDRQRYLNAILTSNVRDLKPGQGTIGLLLTPQGHILAEIETLAAEDKILAVSHAMVRERTFATLDKFIIMDDVTLEDVTASTGTLDLVGPRAAKLISELAHEDIAAMPDFTHFEARVGAIPCRIVRHNFAENPAAMLIVAREQLILLWNELEARVRSHGGSPAGMNALNSVRLESGTAWFGHDYDDKNIPHEAGLEISHISYEKGCYTGQEIVERVRSRGHVNRRLTALKFPDAKAPAPGTKLLTTASQPAIEAGQVTSVGLSPKVGQSIGLGYVRREHSAIGTSLDASGIRAEVISLAPAREKTAT